MTDHHPPDPTEGAVVPPAAPPASVVTVHGPDGRAVVVARGELDVATADALADALTTAADRTGRDVTVDLSGVAFCDAAGLGGLVRAANHADRAGLRIVLRAPTQRIARLLYVTGLSGRFRIVPSRRARRPPPAKDARDPAAAG
ncbi:STAS domain-containing protein [Marinactinospora rubrisoli]|uniref:Anti-sigma factor antagonist n=1 Tax=Marinactinospora rubrisoli TaxID=2715399 RepID=A0ABW2KPD0_9ACTN